MMKYAREVRFDVKDGKMPEFHRLFTLEVLPILKLQKGFKDGIALTNTEGAVGISLWTDKTSADAFQANDFPKVLEKLGPVLTATPRVEGFEVTATTLTA